MGCVATAQAIVTNSNLQGTHGLCCLYAIITNTNVQGTHGLCCHGQ